MEPYFRAWTAPQFLDFEREDGSSNFSSVIESNPVQGQKLVRSELEDIALHILSINVAAINLDERVGKNALHLAVISRSLALVKVLLGRNVPTHAKDLFGSTPRQLAEITSIAADPVGRYSMALHKACFKRDSYVCTIEDGVPSVIMQDSAAQLRSWIRNI